MSTSSVISSYCSRTCLISVIYSVIASFYARCFWFSLTIYLYEVCHIWINSACSTAVYSDSDNDVLDDEHFQWDECHSWIVSTWTDCVDLEMYERFNQYDQKLQVKAEEMMSKIFFNVFVWHALSEVEVLCKTWIHEWLNSDKR